MAKLYYTPEGQEKPVTKKKYLPVTTRWKRAAIASLVINVLLGALIAWQM